MNPDNPTTGSSDEAHRLFEPQDEPNIISRSTPTTGDPRENDPMSDKDFSLTNRPTTDQIATEAALQIYGTNHGTGQLDRPIAIIKATIEKAYLEGLEQGHYDGASEEMDIENKRRAAHASEQEWTAERVGQLGLHLNDYQREEIAKAINAALAAERKRKETALKMFDEAFDKNVKATQGWSECQQQLAAAVEAGREALVALATLKITDSEKPYVEISPTLRSQIIKSHDLLFAALAKIGEK